MFAVFLGVDGPVTLFRCGRLLHVGLLLHETWFLVRGMAFSGGRWDVIRIPYHYGRYHVLTTFGTVTVGNNAVTARLNLDHAIFFFSCHSRPDTTLVVIHELGNDAVTFRQINLAAFMENLVVLLQQLDDVGGDTARYNLTFNNLVVMRHDHFLPNDGYLFD
ncbi:hypothetical protein D3C86_1443500 [compost metagenome]